MKGIDSMQTIDRIMEITEILSSSEERELSISVLSKRCNLPLSTMHRLLNGMIKHGLIEQNQETKFYRLGNTWLKYGLQLYDNLDFSEVVRTELERLMYETGETVYFNKPDGLSALIIERIDSQKQIRIYDQLGIRIPMNIGAANKAMLANMPKYQAEEIINALVESEEREAFQNQLNLIKQQGFSESHSERTPGTSSVGAPVFNHLNKVIGAVSIGFVDFNLTEERLNYLAEQIMKTGRSVSRKLGYSKV